MRSRSPPRDYVHPVSLRSRRLAATPLADDVLQERVRPHDALLYARARGAHESPLPLVEDGEVHLLQVGIRVEHVLQHVWPASCSKGELEGPLRGLLRIGHLGEHLAADVRGQLRHLMVQPAHQRPMVEGSKVGRSLDVALVRLDDEQEVLLDQRLLGQEVRHGLPLLVRLHRRQRLRAGEAELHMQRMQELRPLQGHRAAGQGPGLHLLQQTAGDVAQALRGRRLVESPAAPHLVAELLQAVRGDLAHPWNDGGPELVRRVPLLGQVATRRELHILQQRQAACLHGAPPAQVEVLLLPLLVRLLCERTELALRFGVRGELLRADLLEEGQGTGLVLELPHRVVEEQRHLVGHRVPVLGQPLQPLDEGRLVGPPLALEELAGLGLRETGAVPGTCEVAVQHAREVDPELVHGPLVGGPLQVQLPRVEVVLVRPLDGRADLLLGLLLGGGAVARAGGAPLEELLQLRDALVAQARQGAAQLQVHGLEVDPRWSSVHPRHVAVNHLPCARVEAAGSVRLAAAGAVQGVAHGRLRDVRELPPQLYLVDGLVVQQLLAELVERLPRRRRVIVPVRQGAELGRPAARPPVGVLAQPAEDLAAQLQDLPREELARPAHLAALAQLGGHGRGQQRDGSPVQQDQVVQRRSQGAGDVLEVAPHLLQHVLVDGARAVVLVPEHEDQPRLQPGEAQVAHREQADLEQVLELARQLALVVDQHEVAARHAHERDLPVEDAALGPQGQQPLGVEDQHRRAAGCRPEVRGVQPSRAAARANREAATKQKIQQRGLGRGLRAEDRHHVDATGVLVRNAYGLQDLAEEAASHLQRPAVKDLKWMSSR
mmetsp:Transcript_465/g.1425  ORF Transcript_465/g.1425 Transcript_465/m.1425 type:complete len:832 (+) Transcript_465:994-3489(+)